MRSIRLALFGSEERSKVLPIPAPISWDRVQELAKHNEISFEAHTVSHLAMSRLSDSECTREMEYSSRRIESMTGRRVRHFCYPYGGHQEIGTTAPQTVRRFFRSATTTNRGRCSNRADLALLPRVLIDGEDSTEIAAFKVTSAR